MDARKNRIFWTVAAISYLLAVSLSFARIYVYHAYPTFYTEDDKPVLFEELFLIPNFLHS